MKIERLTPEELDSVVSFAYGGGAYRAGRKAQARAIRNLLFCRRSSTTGANGKAVTTAPA